MAKQQIAAVIKLQVPAGRATPAPPVGPALGPHGVSAPQFVQQFNDRTKNVEPGLTIPVVITVFGDRSFGFIVKSPPASVLLKRAAKLAKGSGNPSAEKVGSVTRDDLKEIAEMKMADLNASDIEAAMRMIEGTAYTMGITIV